LKPKKARKARNMGVFEKPSREWYFYYIVFILGVIFGYLDILYLLYIDRKK